MCVRGRVSTLSGIEEDLYLILSPLLQSIIHLLLNTLAGVATAVGEHSGELQDWVPSTGDDNLVPHTLELTQNWELREECARYDETTEKANE